MVLYTWNDWGMLYFDWKNSWFNFTPVHLRGIQSLRERFRLEYIIYNLTERADFEDIFSLNWLRVTIAIYKSIAERTQTTTFFGQFFPWWFATTDLARKISLAIFPSKKKKYVKHVWSISVFFRYSFLELLCFTSEVIIIWAGYWAKRVITLSYWD